MVWSETVTAKHCPQFSIPSSKKKMCCIIESSMIIKFKSVLRLTDVSLYGSEHERLKYKEVLKFM